MAFQSINPATEALIAEYPEHGPDEIAQRLAAARAAFQSWREIGLGERTAALTRVAAVLERNQDTYARLITAEMGKPLGDARSEIAKCATVCRFYAERAAVLLAPEPAPTEAADSYVAFDPLGPVLAIMPWNFPFWQVFRFAAPALAAGNVGVLKHATNVCGTALAIESAFRDAGVPAGVFQTLLISSAAVESVIADDRIVAVTLTGSERAGAAVAAAAGRVVKKSVLELGGSDPFLVLADADLPRAAKQAAAARTVNSGQSCIAAKRFIVEDAVADRFVPLFVAAMEALPVGDPLDPRTRVGPLARRDLRDEVARQVERTVAAGAELACGGRVPDGPGFFYPPTVLDRVEPGMPAFDEEVFGPIAAVVRVRDEGEALVMANRSRYGLGASIWTGDVLRAKRLSRRLDAGMVFINDIVRSDPRLPFGGVKRSGFGRELSHYGLREFVNIRTIVVGAPTDTAPSSIIE
jgi:succinate-semialdehyde dehydrogenase/glutarate-semialdehyde dehydrogenase